MRLPPLRQLHSQHSPPSPIQLSLITMYIQKHYRIHHFIRVRMSVLITAIFQHILQLNIVQSILLDIVIRSSLMDVLILVNSFPLLSHHFFLIVLLNSLIPFLVDFLQVPLIVLKPLVIASLHTRKQSLFHIIPLQLLLLFHLLLNSRISIFHNLRLLLFA